MVFSSPITKILCILFLYFTAYYCVRLLHNKLDKWGNLSKRQTQRRWRIFMGMLLIVFTLILDWQWSNWIVALFPTAVNFDWPMLHTIVAVFFCCYVFWRFVWLKWNGSQHRCRGCGGAGFKTKTYKVEKRFITGAEKRHKRYPCSSCKGKGRLGLGFWQVIRGESSR